MSRIKKLVLAVGHQIVSVKVHFSPKSGGAAQTLPLCCPASFTRNFFLPRPTINELKKVHIESAQSFKCETNAQITLLCAARWRHTWHIFAQRVMAKKNLTSEPTKMDVNAHISQEPRREMRNDTGDSGLRSEIYREGNAARRLSQFVTHSHIKNARLLLLARCGGFFLRENSICKPLCVSNYTHKKLARVNEC